MRGLPGLRGLGNDYRIRQHQSCAREEAFGTDSEHPEGCEAYLRFQISKAKEEKVCFHLFIVVDHMVLLPMPYFQIVN